MQKNIIKRPILFSSAKFQISNVNYPSIMMYCMMMIDYDIFLSSDVID